MQPLVVVGTLCAALLIVLVTDPAIAGSQAPSARQLKWLPAAWIACFGLAFVVQVRPRLPCCLAANLLACVCSPAATCMSMLA